MKYFLILILALATSCTQKNKTNKELLLLRGPVKSIRTTSYSAEEKFGSIVKGEQTWTESIKKFNEEGMFEETIDYFDGNESDKSIYKYNNKNEPIEIRYYKKGIIQWTSKYVNDTITVYDAKDSIIRQFSAIETYASDTTRYYDDNGNVDRVVIIKVDNKLPQEIAFYDSEGKLTFKQSRKYTPKGQCIEIIDDNRHKIDTALFIYDNQGRLIKGKNCNDPNIPFGSPIDPGIEYTFEYKDYDNYKNWLTCITYKQLSYENTPAPSTITNREIEYY